MKKKESLWGKKSHAREKKKRNSNNDYVTVSFINQILTGMDIEFHHI